MSETLIKSMEKIINQRDIAIKSLKDINDDLSNGEHVDEDWIKDCIELHSGINVIERSSFDLKIKKLEAQLKEANDCMIDVKQQQKRIDNLLEALDVIYKNGCSNFTKIQIHEALKREKELRG